MMPSLKGGRDFTRQGNSTSLHDLFADYQEVDAACNAAVNPGGRVLPYMGYIGMCGPKGYSFSAVLVINWVWILAILPAFWS